MQALESYKHFADIASKSQELNKKNPNNPLNRLSDQLFLRVLSLLDSQGTELSKVKLVCRDWNRVVTDSILEKRLLVIYLRNVASLLKVEIYSAQIDSLSKLAKTIEQEINNQTWSTNSIKMLEAKEKTITILSDVHEADLNKMSFPAKIIPPGFRTVLKQAAKIYHRFHIAQNHQVENLTFEREGKWNGPYQFVILCDPQLGFFDKDRTWHLEVKRLEFAIDMINKMKPKFVLTCGDMTNARPFESQFLPQVRDLKLVMRKIDPNIPMLFVCGNHDVGNAPSNQDIKTYLKHYGDDLYQFWVGGVKYTVFNSCRISKSEDAPKQIKEQNKWLADVIPFTEAEEPKHQATFCHHPWFFESPAEKDGYFTIKKEHRLDLIDAIATYKVKNCDSGHSHRNANAEYQGTDFVTVSDLGRPLGKDPYGFLVVDVEKDRMKCKYLNVEEQLPHDYKNPKVTV